MAKQGKQNGWVYMIKNNGFVKVGITTGSLEARIKNYKTHNPGEIEVVLSAFVLNPSDVEKVVLNIFHSGDKVSGTDWVIINENKIESAKNEIKSYAIKNPAVDEPKYNHKLDKKLSFIDVPFTQIANCVLNDKKLTARAKGIFAYLFSKPNDWDFNYVRVAQDHKESKNTILKTIQELEKYGYLERRRLSSGRIEYFLNYEPVTKDWSEAKTKVGSDQSWVRPRVGHVSNKENTNNKEEESNKDVSPATGGGDIPELIDKFQAVDPNWRRLFGRVNQRSAIERMVKQHGREAIEKIITFLPQNNADPYAPKVTTPIQLEENMGRMRAHWEQKKNKKEVSKIIFA